MTELSLKVRLQWFGADLVKLRSFIKGIERAVYQISQMNFFPLSFKQYKYKCHPIYFTENIN